jgi:hypothetical protein
LQKWQSNLNRGNWHYKTFSLQCYFTPFHNFKDLEIINEVNFFFNSNFELMLLFIEYFKIVLERFRFSLLHRRCMTVVRACPETQLDYSNYLNSRS